MSWLKPTVVLRAAFSNARQVASRATISSAVGSRARWRQVEVVGREDARQRGEALIEDAVG